MDLVTRLVVWLNAGANAVGRPLLAPIGVLPGWLSATLVGAVTGVLLLIVFKYTSNQRAIKQVRDDLKAHLLALKLFPDSAAVAFRSQGGLLLGAVRLMVHAVVPMLVMAVPVSLLVAQLSLWYEARPLRVGEEAVVTLQLPSDAASAWPQVYLRPADSFEITIGPVRVLSQRELCWNLRARQDGYHRLAFQVGDQVVEKELAVGDGLMRVSGRRPGWEWMDALWHPAETPFRPEAPVRSITIDYPERSSWTSGAGSWVVYWFGVSLVSGFCFRRLVNVNL